MTDMRVSLAGVELRNPVIAASGTFGFGHEYAEYVDFTKIGGFALKALTARPRQGNPSGRIAETASGVLNCVGLQNPGVKRFLRWTMPALEDIDTVKIANIAGSEIEEYVEVIELLNGTSLDLYELNVSCPNVREGCAAIGADERMLARTVAAAKRAADKPLIVKLTPSAPNIARMAQIAEQEGADAVSLINTVPGMAIDARRRRPILSNVTGGLSGPAIKPIALNMVRQVYQAVKIPIIGMGGIMTGEDAAEFMLAGATAVMVGTATMADPCATERIAQELTAFCEGNSAAELTGGLIVE